jgi:nucleoid-associated protein YgaU
MCKGSETVRTAALCVADVVAVVLLRPDLGLLGHLLAPRRWLATVGTDQAVVQLAAAGLWLLGCWLAVALGAALCVQLPGRVGALADALAHIALPRALYRLVVGATGVGVLLSPVTASAAPTHRPAPISTPSPSWPSDDALPAPRWPTTARAAQRPPAAHLPSPARTTSVVVARGDSLWSIAAAHLPVRATRRQVADAWPRWYAANRSVIGADPNLITAGERLRVPGSEEQR